MTTPSPSPAQLERRAGLFLFKADLVCKHTKTHLFPSQSLAGGATGVPNRKMFPNFDLLTQAGKNVG